MICWADISISRILPYFTFVSLFLNFAGWHLCVSVSDLRKQVEVCYDADCRRETLLSLKFIYSRMLHVSSVALGVVLFLYNTSLDLLNASLTRSLRCFGVMFERVIAVGVEFTLTVW